MSRYRVKDWGASRSYVLSPSTLLGIEVEAEEYRYSIGDPPPEDEERDDLPELPRGHRTELYKYWSTVMDGSLRNSGVEFVSAPLSGDQVIPAIYAVWALKTDLNAWQASPRTGVHVHLNCAEHTREQLERLLLTYVVLEPTLMHYCGAAREENIFCIPYYRARGRWYRAIPRALREWERADSIEPSAIFNVAPLIGSGCKYSAFNLLPLCRYGTVELRMAPTWDTAGEMVMWAKICAQLREASFLDISPVEYVCANGAASLAREVFSEDVYEELTARVGDIEELFESCGSDYLLYEMGSQDSSAITDTPWGSPASLTPVMGREDQAAFVRDMEEMEEDIFQQFANTLEENNLTFVHDEATTVDIDWDRVISRGGNE